MLSTEDMAEKSDIESRADEKLPASDGQLETSSSTNLYIDPAKEVKLLAKLDMFFVPIIMVVYLSCFLDRSNIGKSCFLLSF